MEGVTGPIYREVILKNYPFWDWVATDFYRVPTVGLAKVEHLVDHMGKQTLGNPAWNDKTIFQILTSTNAQNLSTAKAIAELPFSHVNLNLGCPSRKVINHRGGSYLLSEVEALKSIIGLYRKYYLGPFSVKIRIGLHDDLSYFTLLRELDQLGLDNIMIHARTRPQAYKGIANWNYLIAASEVCKTPIIANGDLWDLDDLIGLQRASSVHAFMFGRSAMKRPWGINQAAISIDYAIADYLERLALAYLKKTEEEFVLKRIKALIRYLFDDLPEGELIKRALLRCQSLDSFFQILKIRPDWEIESLK